MIQRVWEFPTCKRLDENSVPDPACQVVKRVKIVIKHGQILHSWEQRKLGDTFDFLQNNTLSRADLDAETGVAKNVHYGDVLIKFGEYLDASSSALPYIPSQQIVDKFKGSLLQDGDVIMADTAEDEAVGKCTEIAGFWDFRKHYFHCFNIAGIIRRQRPHLD